MIPGDNNELFAAVRSGDANLVADLINEGADIHAKDNKGFTSLHEAAKHGHLDIVEKLIEKGADIHAKTNRGYTPLYLAALNGNLQVVRKLIEKGADINAKNHGLTPLIAAAIGVGFHGKLQVLEELIEKGADVNIIANHGYTLLHLAARHGYLSIVEKLIEKGADINAKNNEGGTPLHLAIEGGYLSTVEKLIEKGADINTKNNYGDTPLHLAAISGHSEVAEFLISKHADVNAKNKDGWTPLDSAAALSKSNGDWVPLSSAAALGKANIIKLLGKENSSEILNLLEERIRKSEEILQLTLQDLQKQGVILSTRVRNHRSAGEEDENSLQNDKIGPNKIGVTSGTSKPSSFINIFAYTTVDTIKGIFQFVSSPFKAAISMEPSKAITVQGIDNNGILLLLDVFIRKITGQKYISTVVQSISPLEAQGYALNIIEEFEKVVEQAALKSGISMHRLNIDYMGVQKDITRKVMSGKFNEISGILNSHLEKACPGREVGCPGKLSEKKFNEFMAKFNKGLDVILNQSTQQILHKRDDTLEVNNIEEQQGPRSYLNNASIQGHLTRNKVKLIS